MAKIKRNDPCRCGSGKKYKNCHMNSDKVKPAVRLRLKQESYIKSWSNNSGSFDKQGCYDWMASIAVRRNPSMMLDIGCGDGSGLLALLRGENKIERIIALDENPSCLTRAKQKLESEGYTVELIERVKVKSVGNVGHEFEYYPIALKNDAQIILIQSDVLTDPYIRGFLSDQGKFDLVTVWLVGTHEERHNCLNLNGLEIKSSGEYRLRVQNLLYEIADRVLSPGGAFHVVDRGEIPYSDHLKQDIVDAHKDQASVTGLSVGELEYIEYEEPNSPGSVNMVQTPGSSGRSVNVTSRALISIYSTQ